MPCKKLTYEPEYWNDEDAVEFNNCYSYAFNSYSLDRTVKENPGDVSNDPFKYDYTCPSLERRIIQDHPGTTIASCNTPCPCNYHKVFMTLDTLGEKKIFIFIVKINLTIES